MLNEEQKRRDQARQLIYECLTTHNEEVLVELICSLEEDYIDIARLSTYGEYNPTWTHQDTLNYLTYHT